MAENKKETGSGQRAAETRQLRPWLKNRLVGKTAWPNQPGPSLGERSSRLLRRVADRQPLVSRRPDAMAFSSPIHGGKSRYPAASPWSALELLVSGRDAGHVAPSTPAASALGRSIDSGKVETSARAPSQGQGPVARRVVNAPQVVTGSGHQPARATIVRRRIEENAAFTGALPLKGPTTTGEKPVSSPSNPVAEARDAASVEGINHGTISGGRQVGFGEKSPPAGAAGGPQASREAATDPAEDIGRVPLANEVLGTRASAAPPKQRRPVPLDTKSPPRRTRSASARKRNSPESGEGGRPAKSVAGKRTNRTNTPDFVPLQSELAADVQAISETRPDSYYQNAVGSPGEGATAAPQPPPRAARDSGERSKVVGLHGAGAIPSDPASRKGFSPVSPAGNGTARMTSAEGLSMPRGSEDPLVGSLPGAGTVPSDLPSRKRFSLADDSPETGSAGQSTHHMTSTEGVSMPPSGEVGSSFHAAVDAVRVQRNVGKSSGLPSPVGLVESPAMDVGEMPKETAEREGRSRHVQASPAESDFRSGRGADKASPAMGSSVQPSVTVDAAPARTHTADQGDRGPGASNHATPRRAGISLPATAGAGSEPLQGTADKESSRGRLNSWPSSGSDAGSIERSSHHGMSLPVARAGNSKVFPNPASPTATPGSLGAATPAMDLPVARISRAQAQGGTQDSGSIFRQPSANPPPPSSIVHTLPGYSSSTARVSRPADDAASPPSPQPTAAQPGEQASPPDLKALARDLYPLIRRMLVIEKERLPHL